jgi:hypothetical protein
MIARGHIKGLPPLFVDLLHQPVRVSIPIPLEIRTHGSSRRSLKYAMILDPVNNYFSRPVRFCRAVTVHSLRNP